MTSRRAIVAIALLVSVTTAAPAVRAEPQLAAADPVQPAAEERPVQVGRGFYRAMIERESARHGLPAEIAEAVMAVESGYDASARGAAGEVGLMQVMPGTARMLGFAGATDELADPATNIRYGVTYLARAWRLAGEDICTATMKYRAGHGETRFSQLSVKYCLAVRAKLSSRGYAVTGAVPAATFGFSGAAPRLSRAGDGACRGLCLKGSGPATDVAALNQRLESIVFSVRTVSARR